MRFVVDLYKCPPRGRECEVDMLFGQNRDELRRFYVEAWRKYRNKLPLQPLEALISEVIALHPEYHGMLEDEEQALAQEFSPEGGVRDKIGFITPISDPKSQRL